MDVIDLQDSRRIPLNNTERATRKGPYPYYGANGQVDTVDGFIFDGEYILLAEDGGYFDDPSRGVAYEVDGKFWVNNHAHIFLPKPTVVRRFLTYVLNNHDWMPYVGGSTRLKLTQQGMRRVRIPLPSLDQQVRIASRIDALLSRSKSVRNELSHMPKLIERYRQSVLSAAFSGKLIGQDFSGEITPISSVVKSLDQGWSPKCENYPSASSKDWAVIKTTAIQPISFLAFENKALPKSLKPRPHIEIAPGDVLITRAGPRSRVGISCVVRQTRPRLMLADKVYRLKLVEGLADPVFVTLMLNSPPALELIERMKTGMSDSGLNLTQDKFLGLPIPMPSLPDQHAIVQSVEGMFGRIDQLMTDGIKANALLDRLDRAILAKAFPSGGNA